MIKEKIWKEAQDWELDWHINQQFNTFNEELKQYTYAALMGLGVYASNHYGINGLDFGDKSILDVGGGEVSMLLKSKAKRRVVVDPLPYPKWVKMRYKEAGIQFLNIKAEEMDFDEVFDEAIIYNCLQHTEDPELIIKKMIQYSKLVRIFEWIDEPISPGHIHILTEEKLNEWLMGEGKVVTLNQNPCVGKCYFGIFKGYHYEV